MLSDKLEEWALEYKAEGKAVGVQEWIVIGKAEGKAEGVQEGELLLLQKLLSKRFGPIPSEITA